MSKNELSPIARHAHVLNLPTMLPATPYKGGLMHKLQVPTYFSWLQKLGYINAT